MKIALFGYTGGGKTRLVEIAVGKRIENFDPFQPVITLAKAQDPRLEKVAKLVKAAKITAPEVEIHDIKGVPRETGADAAVIGLLTAADRIVLVVDNFSGDRRPEKDIPSLMLELILRDTERLMSLAEKRKQEQAEGKRQSNPVEDRAIEKAVACLESEKMLSAIDADEPEKTFLSYLDLVTVKPAHWFLNGPAPDEKLLKYLSETGLSFSAVDLSTANSEIDLSGFWSALWETSGLITFYTAGEKETRGWLLRKGASALDAAAEIHTDIAKGFIRAEVISCDDFIKHGSHTACRNANLMRLEMKEYVVADGDVINIRFSKP